MEKKLKAKRLDPKERERQIIEHSVDLFAKKGFSVSTRDIAERCGITQPLLYRYFSNKSELIEKIYKDRFLSKWQPEWKTILKDRNKPLAERINNYLKSYVEIVTQEEWIRLFIYSALDDAPISNRFLDLLEDAVLNTIAEEARHEFGITSLNEEKKEIEKEMVWAFHSTFFYIGVRKNVYGRPVPQKMGPVIDALTQSFLQGYKIVMKS